MAEELALKQWVLGTHGTLSAVVKVHILVICEMAVALESICLNVVVALLLDCAASVSVDLSYSGRIVMRQFRKLVSRF